MTMSDNLPGLGQPYLLNLLSPTAEIWCTISKNTSFNTAAEMMDRRPVPSTVSEALVQATTLLTIPNLVRVMAWRKLGQILQACGGDGTPQLVGNATNSAKTTLYEELVDAK